MSGLISENFDLFRLRQKNKGDFMSWRSQLVSWWKSRDGNGHLSLYKVIIRTMTMRMVIIDADDADDNGDCFSLFVYKSKTVLICKNMRIDADIYNSERWKVGL